jgi:hypothetical protein
VRGAFHLLRLCRTDRSYLNFCGELALALPDEITELPEFQEEVLYVTESVLGLGTDELFQLAVKLAAMFSGLFRENDGNGSRFDACIKVIHERLESGFDRAIWGILSAWLDCEHSHSFSQLAITMIGRDSLSLDDQAVVLFFIGEHLVPELAPLMEDIFGAIIKVQLARASAFDNTDDCLYSFVSTAVSVFGQDACYNLFLGTARSMIQSGDLSDSVVGLQILSDLLGAVPVAILDVEDFLLEWMPQIMQSEAALVGFPVLWRLAEHTLAFRCDWDTIFQAILPHVNNPNGEVRYGFWSVIESLFTYGLVDASSLIMRLLEIEGQALEDDRDLFLTALAQGISKAPLVLPDAWLEGFRCIVCESFSKRVGAVGGAALCLALFPVDRDLFSDLVETAVAFLVASLDSDDKRHVRVMAYSFDTAMHCLGDEFADLLRPHLARLLDFGIVAAHPHTFGALLPIQAYLYTGEELVRVISAFLVSTDRRLLLDAMAAVSTAQSKLSVETLSNLVRVILERFGRFGFEDSDFARFLQLLSQLLSPERSSLTSVAVDLLRDMITGDNARVIQTDLATFLTGTLALASGCVFAHEFIHHELVFPFALMQFDAQPECAAPAVFEFFTMAFEERVLTSAEAASVLERALETLAHPKMRAQTLPVALCIGAAVTAPELRAEVQPHAGMIREKWIESADSRYPNCRAALAALLLLLDAGETSSLVGEALPGDAGALALFMRALIAEASKGNPESGAAIARQCYTFLALPPQLVTETELAVEEVVACVAVLDPQMEILAGTMDDSRRQRERVRQMIMAAGT